QRVGAELAMHVVAAKPLVLTKELVSSEAVQNEREILKSQVEDKNVPLDVVQRVGAELAMHVVAAKPLVLTKELVS
nr:elongation factor Ts, mitochondrial [Tanacetum cinerariifolium]